MNECEVADLKAELEQVDYQEFEELRKRVEVLEFKFNELLDWLCADIPVKQTNWMLLKIKGRLEG